MANDRLRAAITHAGLDPDQLASLLEVDVKTVQRWLSGRTPYPRHRTQLARALGRSERELWPDAAITPSPEDARREILAAYPHANDLRAADWRALMRDAVEQIDLLSYSLIEILSAPGTIDLLATKATAGTTIRILTAAPDSAWVSATAIQLEQDTPDFLARSDLQREIELARGYLQSLIVRDHIEGYEFYAERTNTILRFDDQMLLTLHLWATPGAQAPLLHLRRHHDDGLFDQFATHLETILHQTSQPLQPDPDHYPDPHQHPDRYKPITEQSYQELKEEIQERIRHHQPADPTATTEVRQELRRQRDAGG
jgi:transcriptional regulator with XRE-family HTH domain